MIKTMKDWKTDLSVDFQAGDEVDQEVYFYNLEVLPPIELAPRFTAFQVSEPQDHQDNGHARYSTFKEVDGHDFYMGTLSTRQARELLA